MSIMVFDNIIISPGLHGLNCNFLVSNAGNNNYRRTFNLPKKVKGSTVTQGIIKNNNSIIIFTDQFFSRGNRNCDIKIERKIIIPGHPFYCNLVNRIIFNKKYFFIFSVHTIFLRAVRLLSSNYLLF